MEKKECLVIGAGIAGMTAAIYLKRFGIDVLIVEKELPGGQLNKTKNIKNYPGFLEADGEILANRIFKQMQELEIDYRNENVLEVMINADEKRITTNKNVYECNQLILATGRVPRQLKAENESTFLGRGISYCAVCDGFFFKGKDVAVIGGGASAIENAIYLSNIVKKCYLICRRDKLRGDEVLISSLSSKQNIEILYNANVKKFVGNEVLEKIEIGIEENISEINVNGAFVSIGYEPNYDIISKVALNNQNGYLEVDKNCETNIAGVFAIGDAIFKDLYQLTTAVSEASIASNYIKKTWYK